MRLADGKKVHRKIQDSWLKTAEGIVFKERTIPIGRGRKGRMDIFIQSDGNLIAIAEIKNSDWDRKDLKEIKRNVNRQISQIWNYIESQLDNGNDVSPGIVFPKKPKSLEKLHQIEGLFEERGIAVIWEDESVLERKNR